MPDWLLPWTIAALVIYPLYMTERWIHRHIQGIGLLVTNNPQAAVLVYYMSLFPGVLLHELSQWILAQILRVKIKKFQIWPDQPKGGTIRLGLVEIDNKTDTFRATLIGVIPLITGLLVLGLIGNTRFEIEPLLDALSTGDMTLILAGIGQFMSVPDFWLWIYLVFAIGNAMLPEPHDEINWWLLLGIIAAIVAFLLLIGLGVLVRSWLNIEFAAAGSWVSLALLLIWGVDLFMMAIMALLEWILSEVLNREVEYG